MLIIDQLRKGDRQLQMLSVGILLGMGILLGGLWYVQIVCSKRYQASQVNQSVRMVRLPSIRGRVLDCDGIALADNRANYTINMYLDGLRRQFGEEYSRLEQDFKSLHPGAKLTKELIEGFQTEGRYRAASNSIHQLALVLELNLGITKERFTRHYEQQRAYPLLVVSNLGPQYIARFMERGTGIPGVDLEIQPERFYPYGELAVHLLGHVRRDSGEPKEEEEFDYRVPDFGGETGVERAFDDDLRGLPGVKSITLNNVLYRHEEQIVAEPQPGSDVWLTIDLQLQRAVESALRSSGEEIQAAAVVMDVNNGDILAMASYPGYDPNIFITGFSAEFWHKELNNPDTTPQLNRATAGAYNPGSIFKIISGLACLEANIMSPDEIFTKRGPYRLGRRTIADTAPDGDYNFLRAFIKSCNAYFVHYGLKAGMGRVLAMAHQFKLGEGTDLPTQEVVGEVPAYKDIIGVWGDGNLANVCIGQEITITPIQAAVMVSAIANGGKVFWPRLVDRVTPPDNPNGQNVKRIERGRLRSVVELRPENLALVHASMREDVNSREGTGFEADVPGMDICGKTGTAQIKKGGRQVDKITWFASFAPQKQPKYAVVIMVESGASGGKTCAPIARKVYQAIQKLGSDLGPRPNQVTSIK